MQFHHFRRFLSLSIALSLSTNLFAHFPTSEGDDREPVTPQIAEASDEAEQAISSFRKPDGWQCTLAAAEPELANPVAFFIDNSGRMFVCESFRQGVGVTDNRKHNQEWLEADLAAQTVEDRIKYHRELLGKEAIGYELQDDRIRLLKDADGDGRFEESIVFADHFNRLEDGTGAGVLVRGNEAFYTCIPKLWRLTDADGDGKAEQRDVIYDGFGVRVAFRGHDMHGLIIGPDGRLYFSIGDRGYHVATKDGVFANPESGAVFRCELDGSNLEVVAKGLRNPQELAFDDDGNLFTGDNNSDSGDRARWVYVAEGGDSGWRMFYQYLPDRGPFNRERLWYPYDQQTPAYIVPPIANFADGPSGLTYYPGTGLGDEYRGTFFLCDFRGGASNSGIRSFKLLPKGAFFEIAEAAEPIWNILATDADFGPDGSLYVTDWVNGWEGEGKGRIYRFFKPDQIDSPIVKEVKAKLAEGMKGRDAAELLGLLGHPDRRLRLESQFELASRDSHAEFAQVATNATESPLARLHAVWGLGQIARVGKSKSEAGEVLLGLLKADDAALQVAVLNAVADAKLPIDVDLLSNLLKSDNPRVRYFAAQAAGKLHVQGAFNAVVSLLESNADADPIVRHGGIIALAGSPDADQVVALKSHPSKSVRVAAVVALRKRYDERVAEFLSDADPGVVIEAARAIYDEPKLHGSLPQLAALISKSTYQDDALLRRVLNANYRLGTADNAISVARFAADPNNSIELQVEAIELLQNWAKPSKFDRVLNRYSPIETNRPENAAAEALRGQLASLAGGKEAARQLALRVAAELGITEVVPILTKSLNDPKSSETAKSQSIEALVKIQGRDALKLVAQQTTSTSALVRSVALRNLAQLDPAAAIVPLKKAVQSSDRSERQQAWDTAATIQSPEVDKIVEGGVEMLLAGKLPADAWLNALEAGSGRLSAETKKRLDTFLETKGKEDSLAAYLDCVEGGDAARGANLFYTRSELSCVRCHKVGTRGGEVGPLLSQIGKQKDRRYLLEAIVNPDAAIAQNFETVVVLTDEDQVYTGILKSEDKEKLQLVTAEGQAITLDQSTIVERRKGKSSMPVDLLKYLSKRELRDLVAFLSSLDGTYTGLQNQVEGHGK